MATNVVSLPFLDFRVNVKADIETLPSEAKFPFYTQAFLIPRSKVADYLVGDYDSYVFYKISESDYATKCIGDFLKGMTTFYNQPHTEAGAGVIIFEDSIAEDSENPATLTPYVNATQANRLAIMQKVLDAIGRNAIAVAVAIDVISFYEMVMNDFRQIDSMLTKLKIKIKNSAVITDNDKAVTRADYQAYGGTIIIWQQNEVFTTENNKTISFEYRGDFIVCGAGLNPMQRQGDTTILPVGMNWDGMSVNIPQDMVSYNDTISKDDLQSLTDDDISYFQVRGDDKTEVVITDCGVFYQGKSIPASIFLLAKYAEYRLQTAIFDAIMADKSGVASVNIYRKALSSAKAQLSPYVDFILNTLTIKNYTQTELNNLVDNKVLKLTGCINMVTNRITKFTEASISVLAQ